MHQENIANEILNSKVYNPRDITNFNPIIGINESTGLDMQITKRKMKLNY